MQAKANRVKVSPVQHKGGPKAAPEVLIGPTGPKAQGPGPKAQGPRPLEAIPEHQLRQSHEAALRVDPAEGG